MRSRDFCYWLQGFFEVANPREITAEQTEMIKRHLSLVFVHEIDPSMGGEDHQQVLNKVHSGKVIPSSPNPESKVLYRC